MDKKPRLQKKYDKEIAPALMSKFGLKNSMAVPKFSKVVLNIGLKQGLKDPKFVDHAEKVLSKISGQKPVKTLAKKSISNFKIREGMVVGMMVTLRGKRMYDYLDKLINVTLPRVRDFRGLDPDAFDGRGNYNLGLTEQMVFPEINPDKFTYNQGMNITLVTSAENDKEARELLRFFGMPLRAA